MADKSLWIYGLHACVDNGHFLTRDFAAPVTRPSPTRPGSRAAGFSPKPAASVSQHTNGCDHNDARTLPLIAPFGTHCVEKGRGPTRFATSTKRRI
jgi:hypothetical protein